MGTWSKYLPQLSANTYGGMDRNEQYRMRYISAANRALYRCISNARRRSSKKNKNNLLKPIAGNRRSFCYCNSLRSGKRNT